MPKVHSHYENLKVARDASAQEIRAAYRTLTRQHHPDRNPGNPEAERVMSVINVAYSVLSEPAKRSEHDRWIVESEAPSARPVRHATTLHRPAGRFQDSTAGRRPRVAPEVRQAAFDQRLRRAKAHGRKHRWLYGFVAAAGVVVFGGWIALLLKPELLTPTLQTAPVAALPMAKLAGYERPIAAPNGKPWPDHSDYVPGYPAMSGGGDSEVTVDNRENEADMFAKLVALDGPTALPVRTFYVAPHSRFVLRGLLAGTYDLRYRNLVSGTLARSPSLILEDVTTAHGVQHGSATVKLYQAATGNMLSYSLPEADF